MRRFLALLIFLLMSVALVYAATTTPNIGLKKPDFVPGTWGEDFNFNWDLLDSKFASGGGIVSSVGLSLPASMFSITGSPVTGTGTLTGSFISQVANRILAGPSSGGDAAPTFRLLVDGDIPALSGTKIPGSHPHTSGAAEPGAGSVAFIGEIYKDTRTFDCTLNRGRTWVGTSIGGNFSILAGESDNITKIQGNTGSWDACSNLNGGTGNIFNIIGGTGLTVAVSGSFGSAGTATVTDTRPKSITFRIGSDTGSALVNTDDEATVWRNNIAAMTITEVWCETDQGSSTINLQRDDGSPANILSSDLVCTTSGATGSIAGAEDNVAAGDKIDFVMVTAATSGTPKRITVNIKMTVD